MLLGIVATSCSLTVRKVFGSGCGESLFSSSESNTMLAMVRCFLMFEFLLNFVEELKFCHARQQQIKTWGVVLGIQWNGFNKLLLLPKEFHSFDNCCIHMP